MLSKSSSQRETTNVLSHWYTFIDGVRFSAVDFYRTIEDELKKREVPRLHISRIDFHEGGVASDKRIYLRLARERYAFDICAAPFGRGYFFSFRLIEMKRSWFQFLLLLALATVIWIFGSRNSGPMQGLYWVIGTAALVWAVLFVIRSQADGPGEQTIDLDAFLLNIAVIGALYERARSDTYFRQDTRLLFHTVIAEIVKNHAEALTSAKGVKLLRTFEYSPAYGDLFTPEIKPLAQVADAVA